MYIPLLSSIAFTNIIEQISKNCRALRNGLRNIATEITIIREKETEINYSYF